MSDLRDQVTPADLSGREPTLRIDDEFAGWAPAFTVWIVRRGQRFPMIIDSIWTDEATARKRVALFPKGQGWEAQPYSHLQPIDAARAPVGLEGLLVALKEEMIEGWRDSTTPTTFGVVSSLIEALVNSCVPVQDPADRAWDAATGVVERGTPPRDPHERDCDICGKPMTDVDYFASVIRCPTCESTLVVR